jgi:acyl-CoA synthetase (AMP-forming)/AMP-acid ligase II
VTATDKPTAANLIERAPSAYNYPLLVKHLLNSTPADAADQEIVYRDLRRFDYRTLRQRIGQLATGLVRLGVKPGTTVAVMDWDSHRYLECFFAVPMLGAVLHTVNVRLSPDQILYTMNHAGDDVVLVNAEFLPVLEEIRDRIQSAHTFVLLTDRSDEATTSLPIAVEYEAMLASSSASHAFRDFDENTRATTSYTTGTTGLPKGVYFSHRQVVLGALATMAALGSAPTGQRLHRADVYMPITPMFHVQAWGIPYIATMLGIKQVYPGRYRPDELLGLIQREKVTFSHCVPTLLHMLLESPESQKADLDGWKVMIGGSPLPTGLTRAALERGIDVFGGYGMSEMFPGASLAQLTPAMLVQDTERQVNVRVTAGRHLPLVELRTVDDQLHDLPHDGKSAGEVVVRAPWLTQGYLEDPQNSEQLWRGGYLHTGDIGTLDSLGYLRITDRIKDVIKSGGEWISALQIEDILTQFPGVREAAVIGVPDEQWGERPLALVVATPSHAGSITEQEIKALVARYADKGVISKSAIPSRVLFVDTIAKTSVGKIDKKVLREKYAHEK